ncbi:MAG: M1 family metallopeptidase [Gemmatimonadales bacterium]|nr:M1 family metallopeptidase [Gemmatimonadales bacterium]
MPRRHAVALATLLGAALPVVLAAQAAAPARPARWQQRVRYDITATLDEARGVLDGATTLLYHNRSPDTLRQLSFHLHLNAFRPGSAWAARDSMEGQRRFNDLADPAFGFNHVRDVRIGGQPVLPQWPLAPDSTIVRFKLPAPLAPGDSVTVTMGWDARPSLRPRRQGRRGRHYDFAHWYPKVVVYDRYGWNENPLVPAGEFYGEFGDFTVRLDTPDDQVIGATGVPLCGDPGWAAANRNPARPVELRRDAYPVPPAVSCDGAAPGRKVTTWHARDVHHFALSLSPDYRYEGGAYGPTAVHVLYQPGDTATWGGGVAVARTERALAWLARLFGPFAWPQLTNVHRIEGGGTEFPMMIHDGSADQGLIVHELGHNYVMGILANNEWREGWLDEGFTSFQATWFEEVAGRQGGYEGLERYILDLDLDGLSEPTSLESHRYRDFPTYGSMVYARGELFFHQLRDLVGVDTMVRILRTHYARNRLQHVDEDAFRQVAEEVSGRDLKPFFGQFLHATDLYDYAVGRVRRRPQPRGGWITEAEVVRRAPGRYPVEVAVETDRDTARVRVSGLAEREWVTLETVGKPRRVVVDPRARAHDWNMLNNARGFGLFAGGRNERTYLDTFFSQPVLRDAKTIGWLPFGWFNDAGGFTAALRMRSDYLGRFEQDQLILSFPTGWGAVTDGGRRRLDTFLRLKNPTWLQGAGWSQLLEAWDFEGRYGGKLAVEKRWRSLRRDVAVPSVGLSLTWLVPRDFRWVDAGQHDQAATLELTVPLAVTMTTGGWSLTGRASAGAGLQYGVLARGLPFGAPLVPAPTQVYGRAWAEGIARRSLGAGWSLGVRGMAGYAGGQRASAPQQRQFFLNGSDPLEQLYTPGLRSVGGVFRESWLNYHAPGSGPGVRAVDPTVAVPGVMAMNVELEKTLAAAPRRGLFNRIAVAGFADGATVLSDRASSPFRAVERGVIADAGIGLRAAHRIGDTRLVTRFDVPLWLSRPAISQNGEAAGRRLGFRWVVSWAPAF